MHIAAALVAVLLLSDPSPVTGETDATPTPTPSGAIATPEKPKRPGGDRLVCRRETKPNSRFTTKVCKTVDEWEQRTEAAVNAFSETQNRPVILVCPPQGC